MMKTGTRFHSPISLFQRKEMSAPMEDLKLLLRSLLCLDAELELEQLLGRYGFSGLLIERIRHDPGLRQEIIHKLQHTVVASIKNYNEALLAAVEMGSLELVEILLPKADYFVRAMDQATRLGHIEIIRAIRHRIETYSSK